MKFNVTEIEFDFDEGDIDDPITFEEQVQIIHDNLVVWEADNEDDLIEGIEAQIYDVKEEDLLRVMNVLKAQAKQPKAEW